MIHRLFIPHIVFIFIVFLLAGCSVYETPLNAADVPSTETSSLPVHEGELSDISIKPLSKQPSGETDIEITWKPPMTPVDGFVIKYGLNKDTLSQTKKVSVASLQLLSLGAQGEVYRYRLTEAPQGNPLYISIASYVGDVVSSNSEVVEVSVTK